MKNFEIHITDRGYQEEHFETFISLIVYFKTFSICMNCIFLTLKIIPGESYGRKILKKIPDVPFREIHQSSHFSSNLLCQG